MSWDMEAHIKRASKACRSAHDDFRALYQVIGSHSDTPMLKAVGADLDALALKLHSLSTSTVALSSSLAHDLFETRVSADIKLSHGIIYDMKAIGRRLRSMKPSALSEPEMIMDEREGNDVRNMVKRYYRAVTVILDHHQLCV
jgi:hypothetical protein